MLWPDKKESKHSFLIPCQNIAAQNYHLTLSRYKKPLHHGNNTVPLGELCHIVIGETPLKNNPKIYGGKHLFVRIKDLTKRIINQSELTLNKNGITKSRLKPIAKGTLLFGFKLAIGRVAFVGKKLYISESIAGLIPKDGRVLSHYLYYLLPHLDYSPYVNRDVKGVALNKSLLAQIAIPLPSLSFQQKLIRHLQSQDLKKERCLKTLKKIAELNHHHIKNFLNHEEKTHEN